MKLHMGKCPKCDGDGTVTREGLIFSREVRCPKCGGRGLIHREY